MNLHDIGQVLAAGIDIHHTGLLSFAALQTAPGWVTTVFTWVKTGVGIGAIAKGYKNWDDNSERGWGPQIQSVIPQGIILAGIGAPNLLNGLIGDGPIISAMSGWKWTL